MNDSISQREQCVVCGKDVTDTWFARIRRGNAWVKLCSPSCSMRYSDSPNPVADARGDEKIHFETRS